MAEATTDQLERRLVDRIARHGPLPFSAVMDAALYDEDAGFYSAGGSAGRRGDFVTSVEVGPLFGAVLARALDTWWDELGRPDPFVVVEGGAGVGSLAVSILAAAPGCAHALRYVMVERSAALRARHGEHLALSDPADVLGGPGGHDGPAVCSLGEMPTASVTGVVLANELLDNLAVDLLRRTDSGWAEVRVGVDDPGASRPRLVRHEVPASESAAGAAARLAPDAAPGAYVPWQREAGIWVADALELLEAGRLLVIDYGVRTTAELAGRPLGEWLRTYRQQQRADDPLEAVGTADITTEVAVDQLEALAGPAAVVRTQAELLSAHGIDVLVDEGRRIWEERAGVGDLAAVRGRSRIVEAEALLDTDGLGGFLAVEWHKG